MIIAILNLLSVVACFLIAIRLITFKKGNKRYRFFISLSVWLIINSCVSIAIWLIFSGFKSIFIALAVTAFLYVFAYQLFICHGNLAALFYKKTIVR